MMRRSHFPRRFFSRAMFYYEGIPAGAQVRAGVTLFHEKSCILCRGFSLLSLGNIRMKPFIDNTTKYGNMVL
jgi:hypothetical protein